MAVPKKKSSRSRTGMRRYSAAYKMAEVSETICEFTNAVVRTHTVSMKAIKEGLFDAGVKAATKASKLAARKTAAKTKSAQA